MDWASLGGETVELMRGYLKVDTTNPPGNETAGTRFLAQALDGDGIASETAESAPGRGNLVARLRGDGSLGGLVLHHHVMVALGPVIPDEQQPSSFPALRVTSGSIRENRQRPNGSVLTASAGHDTPSAVTSPRWLAGALSSARSCVRGNRSAHLPAATRQQVSRTRESLPHAGDLLKPIRGNSPGFRSSRSAAGAGTRSASAPASSAAATAR